MRFRFYLSLIIAKIIHIILKITKLTSGTAIIGLITLKICPDFLIFANDYISETKINITGTNGKTTTSGIISHILKCKKKTLLNNSLGANMLNGIVNALVLEINPFKKYQISVIETDEAFLNKIYEKMDSDYLLVTNLFEDQTDRFVTPLYTKKIIQNAINNKRESVQLILNADEPISASLESNKEAVYFGINNVYNEIGNLIEYEKKSFKCPICEKQMFYTKNFYSQQGYYSCECGYSRQNPKYLADVTLYEDCLIINLNNEIYKIPLIGLYNAYNALGAIALIKELGLDIDSEDFNSFKVAFGRTETRSLYGHRTLLQLIKNPAGANEALKNIDISSNILIAINNNIADGRDISWINQVEFEKLANIDKPIVLTGICAKEMSERLKKANIDNFKIIPDIKKAVQYVGKTSDSNITILTTYTALLKIDKIKEIKNAIRS